MKKNFLYSQVDLFVQNELNARGRAGLKRRENADIDFMVGKIANVKLTAYQENKPSDLKVVEGPYGILGGQTVLSSRFTPISLDGTGGYLNDSLYTKEEIAFNYENLGTNQPVAFLATSSQTDQSKRVGPYISETTITIGDHSLGLLNKATVSITIPNVERDLDHIESIWFYPGRYTKIEIVHPDSAVITKNGTNPGTGLISPFDDTEKKLLAKKYPKLGTTDPEYESLRKLNEFSFEGLITSFEFSYESDGTVQATLSLIGTSNVYTDVACIQQGVNTNNSKLIDPDNNKYAQTTGSGQLHENLNKAVSASFGTTDLTGTGSFLATFNAGSTIKLNSTDNFVFAGYSLIDSKRDYFITLDALISYMHETIIKPAFPGIDDLVAIQFGSNSSIYYEHLVSGDPRNMLLLPATSKNNTDMDCYNDTPGEEHFYKSIQFDAEWPGIYNTSNTTKNIVPGRILYNIAKLKDVNLQTVNSIITDIFEFISKKTASGIDLKLFTNPRNTDVLIIEDANFLGTEVETVIPYSVPMFANHAEGSIVSEFSFSTKIPDNVKNLAYTQNSNPNTTNLSPYLNYMYNSSNADKLNASIQKYAADHAKYLDELKKAKSEYGKNPAAGAAALETALINYIKHPSPKINQSGQNIAPLMPFTTDFTIDGINGLYYGNVLMFSGLPTKYTVNTVFSIIGITHTVTADGLWTAAIKCMMRPKINPPKPTK